MGIFFFLAPVAAFPLAFWAGRIPNRAGRIAGFLAVLLLPIVASTVLFRGSGDSWGMALAILGLPLALWCFAAIGGFVVGASSRQPRD